MGATAQVDAQASPPCTSLANTELGALVGQWTVEWRYRTAPGEFATSTASADIRLDLEGCVVVERFRGMLRGKIYAATTSISQPDEGQYDRIRIDSEHGGFSQSQGSREGEEIVFHWQRDLGSRILRTRHVYRALGDDRFEVVYFMSPRLESDWQLVQSAVYRRQTDQAPDP